LAQKELAQLQLALVVNVDLKIVHVHRVDIFHVQEHHRRVDPPNAGEFEVAPAPDLGHAWSLVRVALEEFADPPHVALPVHRAVPAEGNILDIVEVEKVPRITIISQRPVVVPL